VTTLSEERVRARRWQGTDVDLATVIDKLHELQAQLSEHDAWEQDRPHPHPRNCVLNLVVTVGDSHRAEACDRLVAGLAASHPLRAILVHKHGGEGAGTLDAEITSEAHHLMNGFPVQREQVLLHVRGEAAEHLSSLVEPLLVSDVPTYLWWSGRDRLDERTIRDVMSFSDVLVVDSERFTHPVEALLQLAELNADPDSDIGVADFRWGRLRPWRDAIGQFFAPADRRPFLAGLRELTVEAAGSGPEARVGAALLVGWAAGALGWRLRPIGAAEAATEAVADTPEGHQVRLSLRSVAGSRLGHGKLLGARLSGQAGHRSFALSIARDAGGGHADVVIELGGEPLRQRLTPPRMGDPDLLIRVLWASHPDPVFHDALAAATPLLESLR
jgi:glucose-6-phosphate dehydrogenase assembly protein OpcA